MPPPWMAASARLISSVALQQSGQDQAGQSENAHLNQIHNVLHTYFSYSQIA